MPGIHGGTLDYPSYPPAIYTAPLYTPELILAPSRINYCGINGLHIGIFLEDLIQLFAADVFDFPAQGDRDSVLGGGQSDVPLLHELGIECLALGSKKIYALLVIKHHDEGKAKKDLPAYPVETTLTLIGDKWKVLILRDLMPGTTRYGELKKSVGNVYQKVLTAQLRAMEKCGLVHREVYAKVPPRVEHSLTELGKSLKPILDSMWAWGEAYKTKQ